MGWNKSEWLRRYSKLTAILFPRSYRSARIPLEIKYHHPLACKIIEKCLSADPNERPTSTELLEVLQEAALDEIAIAKDHMVSMQIAEEDKKNLREFEKSMQWIKEGNGKHINVDYDVAEAREATDLDVSVRQDDKDGSVVIANTFEIAGVSAKDFAASWGEFRGLHRSDSMISF